MFTSKTVVMMKSSANVGFMVVDFRLISTYALGFVCTCAAWWPPEGQLRRLAYRFALNESLCVSQSGVKRRRRTSFVPTHHPIKRSDSRNVWKHVYGMTGIANGAGRRIPVTGRPSVGIILRNGSNHLTWLNREQPGRNSQCSEWAHGLVGMRWWEKKCNNYID